jgi:hypothetical protein
MEFHVLATHFPGKFLHFYVIIPILLYWLGDWDAISTAITDIIFDDAPVREQALTAAYANNRDESL